MDLVRKILLELESSNRRLDSSTIRIAGYTGEAITEHMRLLMEAGLAQGIQTYCIEHKLKWIELRLTWSGHDFVDAARNDLVWVETVTTVRSRIGGVPFEALNTLLIEAAHRSVQPHLEPPGPWAPYLYASSGTGVLREQPA